MGELRKPLFFAAMALISMVVLVEIGSSFLTRLGKLSGREMGNLESVRADLEKAGLPDNEVQDALNRLKSGSRPPGLAIRQMALIDGLIVFALALIGVSLLVPGRVHAKYQGIATLLVSLMVGVISLIAIIAFIPLLTLMVTLLTAFPFGTIIYLVTWGTFNRGAASLSMSVIMGLKMGFAVCLVLAQPGFLQNRGLVFIILTSLLANVIVSFLHGLVPVVLVSITDAVAAIVVSALAGLWAIFLLVGAIPSIFKAIA
jgi:hypothetical protein